MIKQTVYAEHIDQICLKNEIVVGKHSSGGRSWRIRGRAPRGRNILEKRRSFRLEKEQFVWEWAKANALEWTDVMQKKMDKCLGSYERWAKRTKP
jgi:hypothetical protein